MSLTPLAGLGTTRGLRAQVPVQVQLQRRITACGRALKTGWSASLCSWSTRRVRLARDAARAAHRRRRAVGVVDFRPTGEPADAVRTRSPPAGRKGVEWRSGNEVRHGLALRARKANGTLSHSHPRPTTTTGVGRATLISRAGEYRASGEGGTALRSGRRRSRDRTVLVTVYPPDRRRRDLDNLLKCRLRLASARRSTETMIDRIDIRVSAGSACGMRGNDERPLGPSRQRPTTIPTRRRIPA